MVIHPHWLRSQCHIEPQPLQLVRDHPRRLLPSGPSPGCRRTCCRHYSCSLYRQHFFTDFVHALSVDHYYSEEDSYWIWWGSNHFGLRFSILNDETLKSKNVKNALDQRKMVRSSWNLIWITLSRILTCTSKMKKIQKKMCFLREHELNFSKLK